MREKFTMKLRHKRKFTPEFRAEAVRLVHEAEGKRSLNEIAVELDVAHGLLKGWVLKAERAKSGPSPSLLKVAERAELAALRREVKQLREEKEILKKAAAFFARENS